MECAGSEEDGDGAAVGVGARALRTARASSPALRTRVEMGDGEEGMMFGRETGRSNGRSLRGIVEEMLQW